MTVTAEREKALLESVPTGLLIDGEWRDASSGKTFDVKDPATGKVYPEDAVAQLGEADVRAKLSAAGYSNIHDVKFDDGMWTAEADASAEASPVGQQVQAFEHAGFPGAIAPDQQVQSGTRLQHDIDQIPQVPQLEADQMHAQGPRSGPWKAERPVEAGRPCSTWNPRGLTAAAASRRGVTARWPPRAPAPRNWRRAAPARRSRRAARPAHPAGNSR